MAELWREYRADLEKTWGAPPGVVRTLLAPWGHPGVRAALLHRIAHRLHRGPLRPVAAILRRVSTALTGAEIHPAASIGPGLHLPHPRGVVIGAGVIIDGPATIFQSVTLGPRGGPADECPRLGSYAAVYPGACVLGAIEIGARAQIGPNCVIYRSLPAGTTVLPPEPVVLEGLSFTLRFKTDGERTGGEREDVSESASAGPTADCVVDRAAPLRDEVTA
jgi:serine O-acetyltransferase